MPGTNPIPIPEHLQTLTLEIKHTIFQNPRAVLDRALEACDQGWNVFGDFVFILAKELDQELGDHVWDTLISTGLFWYLLDFLSDERYCSAVVEVKDDGREVLMLALGNIMRCILAFAGRLWLNAEGPRPNYERGFGRAVSFSKIQGTPQFERYRGFAHEFLDRVPAMWKVLLKTEVNAPDQNCLNWAPIFSHQYAQVALMEIRLHLLYHKKHLPLLNHGSHILMRFWLAFKGPPIQDWGLRCIMPLLGSSSESVQREFMLCYTADTTSAARTVNRLVSGIGNHKIPHDLLVIYNCVFSILVTQLPHSPSLRTVVTGHVERIIMVMYSSISRKLCERFDEETLPVIVTGFAPVLATLAGLLRDGYGDGGDRFGILTTAPMMALVFWTVADPMAQRDEEVLNTLSNIASIYVNIALRTTSDYKPRRNLIQLLQAFWPRCIQRIRRQRFSAERRKKWEDLGKLLKLKEFVDAPQARHKWQGLKPCHLSTCLCNQIKASHSMHVCKGCWHVYYCSVKCQTMDWNQGGHRAACRGRRPK